MLACSLPTSQECRRGPYPVYQPLKLPARLCVNHCAEWSRYVPPPHWQMTGHTISKTGYETDRIIDIKRQLEVWHDMG